MYLKFAELEIKRQEFEQRIEADRRKFEQGLSQLNLDIVNRNEKLNRRLMWAFGIIASILGLIQLGYPDGLPWLMRVVGTAKPEALPLPFPPM